MTVIEFLCYRPVVYSGLDRFNVVLCKKLVAKGAVPVFVFFDTLAMQPAIGNDIKDAGGIVEIIPSPSKGRIKMTHAIVSLYQKYNPDIVHVHFENLVKYITVVLSCLYQCKHFTTFHSTISDYPFSECRRTHFIKALKMRLFYRLLLAGSNSILTISRAIKEQFMDYSGKSSAKVKLLYLGIFTNPTRLSKNTVRQTLRIPDNAVVLLNISAKEKIKGIDILLKSFAKLQQCVDDKFVVLMHIGGLRSKSSGTVQYEEYLFKLADKLGISEKVYWMGIRNDIPDIMPAADIYVHPSLQEGIGMANMEAAVESLPLVGSNVGGIPEIVEDGENGFLFEAGNIDELAEKLSILVNDKELRNRMGLRSYEILCRKFDIEKQTVKLMTYYFN